MTGSERRTAIIGQLESGQTPLSGKQLALMYDVSRQVIVQDIALIRAAGYDIISTNRGYLLNTAPKISAVYKVHHTDDQLKEELCTIVDMGGCVENVMVNHRVYGQIEAELQINSRRKVGEFIESIKSGKSSPLKNITSNYHYHTVSADSRETLNLIEDALRRKHFLIE